MFWNVRAMPAADDLVRRELQQVLAVVEDRAGIRLVESRDDVEGRRLARAVGPDQAEDLTLGDVERDVVEGDDAPEAASEVLDGEQRHEAGILRRGGETSPVVVPLDDGIVRITFPLPLGIDHVHAYALPADDGGTIVVDTGLGLPGTRSGGSASSSRWAGPSGSSSRTSIPTTSAAPRSSPASRRRPCTRACSTTSTAGERGRARPPSARSSTCSSTARRPRRRRPSAPSRSS